MSEQELKVLVDYFRLLAEIESKHKRQKTDENLYNESTKLEGKLL